MTIEKLYQMQKGLDAYIEKGHDLGGIDLFEQKVLALLVEIGELANETRCFKFWSKKGPSERAVVLEEFVDGVHFILSLGLLTNCQKESEEVEAAETATAQFLLVMQAVHAFRHTKAEEDYQLLLNHYFALGDLLGFSPDEVEQAYIAKNEVNYKRQQSGY